MKESFAVVHWSKAPPRCELESVELFDSLEEAERCAEWLNSRQWDFNGDFIADPREEIEVMTASEWAEIERKLMERSNAG